MGGRPLDIFAPKSADEDRREVRELLEDIYQRSGLDFREYAYASIRRRILTRVEAEGVGTVPELRKKVLADERALGRFLLALTVHVTAMFRDPWFYKVVREKVVPFLATYPFIRIWHAGCSTGEEVYSLAIFLEEEGLYSRCKIYATDLSEAVLKKAKAGVFPLGAMREYTENYLKAGGARDFSEYYTARYNGAILKPSLAENIHFARHSLTTDGPFNEFNLVFCRNVMIYFNRGLQNRAHGLIYGSLATHGILALGDRESLRFSAHESCYEEVDKRAKLFRKVR